MIYGKGKRIAEFPVIVPELIQKEHLILFDTKPQPAIACLKVLESKVDENGNPYWVCEVRQKPNPV